MLFAMLFSLLFGAAQDTYYVVIFGYNTPFGRLRPTQSHTFASFVRVRNGKIVEHEDISWCPVVREARAISNMVPGYNKTLKESLADAQGQKMSYWVMKTDKDFFEKAKAHKKLLKNYQMIDTSCRPDGVNCIHAISDVAGHLQTGTTCGQNSGKKIVKFFEDKKVAKRCNDDWIAKALIDTVR